MGAYQCWLAQRERLREALAATGDAAGAAYLTRHTLAQVEQNTMAEQPDDPEGIAERTVIAQPPASADRTIVETKAPIAKAPDAPDGDTFHH